MSRQNAQNGQFKTQTKPELTPYITLQLCSQNSVTYSSITLIKSVYCILSEHMNETGGLAAANGFCSLTSNSAKLP